MAHNTDASKKFQLWFWGIFSFLWVLVISIFILIGLEFFGPLPSFEELENPKSNLASDVISEDNIVLGSYYVQHRTFVDFKNISPNVTNALLATEDIRFYRHSGIDARGLVRVFVKTLIMQQSRSGGGSTITQQLAKNLFPRDTSLYSNAIARKSKLVINKFKEWITAVKLERNYTKDEILAMYLNTVAYGSNSYGIKTAARTFFNTTPDSLKIEQAAVLVGVVNAPTRYSPVRNPNQSIARRNFVLNQMAKYKFITHQERDSLTAMPLGLNFTIYDHNEGMATYFRESLRNFLSARDPNTRAYANRNQFLEDSAQWATNPLYGWCNKNLKPDGTPYNLYRDGLRIYTTINSRMQKYAEEAVDEHFDNYLQVEFDKEHKSRGYRLFNDDLSKEQVNAIMNQAVRQTDRYRRLKNQGASKDSIEKSFNTKTKMTIITTKGERDTLMTPMDSIKHYKRQLRTGFMAMDPRTGFVKVWVGGKNFKHFKYDHVKQGKRQVGSTIKPFLYTLAMQEGYSPCHLVPNVPQTFQVNDTVWSPKSTGRPENHGKMVTLKWGLATSENYISAWIMKQFNPRALVEVAHRMGIYSKIDPVVSAFLGTSEFNVYEMVGAYSTFANKGVHTEPMLVTRIEDKNGNLLATFQPQRNEAISEQTAYLMINLLEGVVNQGTGSRIRWKYNLQGEIAGKTGTTNNHSDGWFMGMVPNLVAGAWVGAEDRSITFKDLSKGSGGNMALPIFAIFLDKLYKDGNLGISPYDTWEKPLRLPNFNLNCDEVNKNDYSEYDFF